ncbi:MAG: protein TolQ [Deltaproteobacteria bacterium]|nr:protein TolQ [Deltaproteobacteria bacterium]
MMIGSSAIVQLVLIVLLLLSVWSWTITIAKFLQFRRARQDSKEFSTIFWETRNFNRIEDSSRRLESSPLAQVFTSGYRELTKLVAETAAAKGNSEVQISTVERALKRAELDEALKLEKGITFLATVASAAPFIGLFGTVWGIMNAFHGLSSAKSTTLQAVAPGISEALVATAIGLAAAIPAAVAYNYFAVAVRQFRDAMDTFSADFLNVARTHVIK